MSRLIDADTIPYLYPMDDDGNDGDGMTLKSTIDEIPTVKAIPKDQIAKAIDKVEEYICDYEKDTVKAQGMAQALDMFEQSLGEAYDSFKKEYENRLKADLVAMLTEIQMEIDELDTPNNNCAYLDCADIIQKKIDKLKEVEQ